MVVHAAMADECIVDSGGPSVRAVTSGYVVTLGTIGGIVAT